MASIGIVNHNETNLEKMFRETETKYEVPYFQREYSWIRDDWSDFIRDLLDSKKNNSNHFFGFMAFQRNGNKVHIIEGQQRIATVLILIAVARDILREREHDKWRSIDENYLYTGDPLSENPIKEPKIVLSNINKRFFRNFILESGIPKEKISSENERKLDLSNRLIFECYKFLYKEMLKQLDGIEQKDQTKFILDLSMTALRQFVVFTIDVEDELAAYNIFQTLNDRGLDLALADLLKVHIFKLFGRDKWQVAKERWDEIRETLFQIKLNTFFRHYWLSKYDVVQEKELLREFQKELKTNKEAENFLKLIRKESEIYEALINPKIDTWETEEVVELLTNLKLLSAAMPLPLLMAGAQKFGISQFTSLLKVIISFVVRYVTIANRDNKTLERLFSNIAVRLREGKLTTVQDIKRELRKEYVDDKTFKQLFITNEIKQNNIAKFILEEIEKSIGGEKEKFNSKITVEHILPKKPDQECNDYVKEKKMEIEKLVYRIGNLTLLLGPANNKAKNKIYSYKQDHVYSKPMQTSLEINKSLATITEWTEKEIEDRQKWMANYAVKTWRF